MPQNVSIVRKLFVYSKPLDLNQLRRHIELYMDENEAVRDRLTAFNGLCCKKVLDHVNVKTV